METSHGMDSTGLDTQLHGFESEAYGAVLKALTAQGGPTWDQIDHLFGLRKELRISDVEHRQLLEIAKSDNSVIMIRQWREGTAGENKMHPKSVNPPPPVGTMGQSAKRPKTSVHVPVSSFTNHSSDIAAGVPSSLATHCSSQCGGEPAMFSSRENLVQSKKSICYNRQTSIVSEGMVIQSKKGHQISEFANIKKSLGSIEIRATNKLIQEVEKLINCGSYPYVDRVEKAKSLLKEQEKAIIGALTKLAEYSDQGDSHIHYDEQQGSGHQLTAPHTFYEQYGNTASSYFCSSLESLSGALKLSPTIAGVTLLSLGNGANDVFSSLVSFMGDGTAGVGLNSILGGAFFVSCIVVGVISITIGKRQVSVDKSSFIRDVLFLLLSLCALLVILVVGKINIWGALCFISLYVVYVLVVSTSHLCRNKNDEESHLFSASPILPTSTKNYYEDVPRENKLDRPLLSYIREDELLFSTDRSYTEDGDEKARTRRCFSLNSSSCSYYSGKLLYILELPLYLPRRLTIPVISEERWSKPCAVISVTLAPIMLAFLWNSQRGSMGTKTGLVINLTGGLVGIVLGTVSFVSTKRSMPPKRCILPWLVGGFLMSVTWSYIIAEELVSLLVSLGNILGISPSILGLTLLSWGNSLGDLIANGAMAMNGGSDGVQVAISGCYAGPIFNTLVGLGLPLVLSCWSEYPSSYVIPKDSSLYETLAFFASGLLWALIILPRRQMKLDRVLGVGLLAIYLCFLSVRMAQTLGIDRLHGSSPL
ncbi:Cation/calcium exchanger [Thalictrum thalictroides]|uniref:Cation/calcium exchanger n=1 Tax=Thalictrum thalictroides TaxID=46969 RepID=A0A7J6X2Q2_THATH|nr:Cation/calcium exchanger [Thalictrum thalictroides]